MGFGSYDIGTAFVWALFVLFVCAPSLWLGIAFGLESVREPRKPLHRRLRWSWIVAMGLVGGFMATPFAATCWFALIERDPLPFILSGFLNSVILMGPPLLLLALVPAVGVAILARSLARRSGKWCLQYGYALRGTTAPSCPECGQLIPHGESLTSGAILRSARSRLWRGLARTAIILSVCAAIVLAALAIYEVQNAVPVDGEHVVCDKCGAIELTQHTPWLHLPVASVGQHAFPASAACEHHWVDIHEAGVRITPLLCTVASRDTLLFQKPVRDTDGRIIRMVYGCLEMPKPGATEFVLRWREGPGLLTAEDAKTASVGMPLILDAVYNYSWTILGDITLRSCEPEELRFEAQEVLGKYDTYRNTMLMHCVRARLPDSNENLPEHWSIMTGSPSGSQFNFGYNAAGVTVCTPKRAGDPLVKFRRISAADWPEFLKQPAPWSGMVADTWEQFEAAPNSAASSPPASTAPAP